MKLSKDIELPYIYLNTYIDINGKLYKMAIISLITLDYKGILAIKINVSIQA